MEVLVPQPPAIASSHLSAPSSPRPSFAAHPANYYYYTSAPSSPSRIAAVYTDLYGAWEEKPLPAAAADDEASDFSFSFHGPSDGERASPALASADDLFEGGMIRPSMPASGGRWFSSSPAKEGSRRDRGRALSSSSMAAAPSRGRRGTRSLSPLRGEEEVYHSLSSSSSSSAAAISALCKHSESKKWKLKDLFLFRSASEGRATATGSKDPLRKHTFLPSSSSLAEGSGGGSESRRRGAALASSTTSAHGMYYSANRAASEEMKKKTPLPYHRHGLFGYLRYNPAIHSIRKGLSGPFSRRQP